MRPVPEPGSPAPDLPKPGEKKRDPHQDYLQAENIVLRTRLEQSRRRQQLILGIAILAAVAVAAIAITILLFSRNGSVPEVRSSGESSVETIPIAKAGTPVKSSPSSQKPQKPETTIPQESPRKVPPPQKSPPVAPPKKASAPSNSSPKQRPDNAEKNKISPPSRKSLFFFLEGLASKTAEENSYTLSCPLPPELANAKDLSVRLRSIGGNTAKKILENSSKYIQKVPGGVRILATAHLPKDGIYDYVPVSDHFLEITVGNKQIHVSRKTGGGIAEIDSPCLMDIECFILKGSTEISVPFALDAGIIDELPFGTIERGSATRYDFIFTADTRQPHYFIYRKSPQEEHFLSFLDFRFAKQDPVFQSLENWNLCRQNLIRNTPRNDPDVETLMQNLSKLEKLLSRFEQEYHSFYRDNDPVAFGGITASQDMKQANQAARTFARRKREYEEFMDRTGNKQDPKEIKKEKEFFQNIRDTFHSMEEFNVSNLNFLRNIVEYNKQQARRKNRENFEAKLRKALLKQIAGLPLPGKEMENIKKIINSGQHLTLFREGPNRNRALEQYFTRAWVTRTVKQERK